MSQVELPGEFLLPKHSHYYVCIQRFMPRVEIVSKHGAAARSVAWGGDSVWLGTEECRY